MRVWTYIVPIVLSLSACGDGAGTAEGGNDDTAEQCEAPMPDPVAAHDQSACMPAATDYQPLSGASDDPYPACATDDGTYPLIADTPSSIARVEAFEEVMAILREDVLDADAFTRARTVYATDEGLESRLVRREDLFNPPVPEASWDPGVDADKQCTVEANVMSFPERCAGPARIAPILNDAFATGQTGTSQPWVEAARIEAALLWFLHLSVYKEANTCLLKEKDCDSSWAYYTGGFDRAGGIGLSGEVSSLSDLAHARIWDGFAAVRCWRELYPIAEFETVDDVDAEGQALLDDAYDQLGRAQWYGWSRIVRDRLEQLTNSCGAEADAHWAFLQIAGPVLDEQSARIGATSHASLWASEEPPQLETLQSAMTTIDADYDCP